MENDPWGKSYKVVLWKLKGFPVTTTMEPRVIRDVTSALFPYHSPPHEPICRTRTRGRFEVLEHGGESDGAVAMVEEQGPISGRYFQLNLEIDLNVQPQALSAAFNTCLWIDTFSGISKTEKPVGLSSSYHPLCLLDNIDKILEKLLIGQIEEFMVTSEISLTDNQFGFRKR